jgi:hypothetical protein
MKNYHPIDHLVEKHLKDQKIEPIKDRWSEIANRLEEDEKNIHQKTSNLYKRIALLAASLVMILIAVQYKHSFKTVDHPIHKAQGQTYTTSTPIQNSGSYSIDEPTPSIKENMVKTASIKNLSNRKNKEDLADTYINNSIGSASEATIEIEKLHPNLDDIKASESPALVLDSREEPGIENKITTTVNFDSLYRQSYVPLKSHFIKFKPPKPIDAQLVLQEISPRKPFWRKALDIVEKNGQIILSAINDRNLAVAE